MPALTVRLASCLLAASSSCSAVTSSTATKSSPCFVFDPAHHWFCESSSVSRTWAYAGLIWNNLSGPLDAAPTSCLPGVDPWVAGVVTALVAGGAIGVAGSEDKFGTKEKSNDLVFKPDVLITGSISGVGSGTREDLRIPS
ncbi:hypothetical protein TRIUR3_11285 [Triticum urartu]|uniref:Uncharacterized protein n=1 Tax=Triticum urartu TaxID=4572 RepID=M7Z3J5_TRIUA|nr:hypothetical protein TRIUR3_11285 [Triticum urartu]